MLKKTAKHKTKHGYRRGILAIYDFLPLILSCIFILSIWPGYDGGLSNSEILQQILIVSVCLYSVRIILGIYRQIWRYGGTSTYIRLIEADLIAGFIYYIFGKLFQEYSIPFLNKLCIICLQLLACITMRLIYQFLYQCASIDSRLGAVVRPFARLATGRNIKPVEEKNNKIKIAIVGAGRVGSSLAEELIRNSAAPYEPVCFVDIDNEKIGRQILGIRVLSEKAATYDLLSKYSVQEIVFAFPKASSERKKHLYERYKKMGFKTKLYDYPVVQTIEKGKRTMREFDIEDLLFREEKSFLSDKFISYYSGKKVLISGGGGSIGSELCRQIAKMRPSKLIVVDVYENGAYDIQQELKIAYGTALDIEVEVISVCDRIQLDKVFAKHRPDIVLHAAAHKHVPLMERNCCEAVKNNVFGTLNIVEVTEKYDVSRFIMISTDKAVNPTNVMGATKRMCEMIVQSRQGSSTNFSATRFGNVLGSNGSVVPLFKRQIANGGPVTLTDKRIIRYFMTIPEASQLVLEAGAMAKNGELFVLDMGKPVKILELAENMIRLSGYEPYETIDIVETGLRPGEKLFEELLIKSEELDKTENKMIFIERDKPLTQEEIEEKLELLRTALATNDDAEVKKALKIAVPTFKDPESINNIE